MADDSTRRIADLLLDARRAVQRIDLPNGPPPADPGMAYAIQDAVTASLGPTAGWKVGASSADAEPACSRLPARLIHAGRARLPAAEFRMFGLEVEIAFRIGRDLPPRGRPYDRAEVEDAIAAVLPAIEVVESRWRAWPEIDRLWHLADSQANGALVCGPERRDWRGIDFTAQRARLGLDGRGVAETVGGNAAEDVIRLVAWLANDGARRGGGLRAGDVVTTGSCTGIIYAKAGARAEAELAGIGRVELVFT